MSRHTDDSGEKRTIAVLVSLSPRELEALERSIMVTKGFRARGTAVRWAMLVVAGAPELAALSLPRAALARALDRRPYRVAKGEPEPVE